MKSQPGPDVDGHDWHSREYVDAWISAHEQHASPTYLAQQKYRLDTILTAVQHDRNQAVTVLDLGAGWGRLARHLLDAFPAATVVAHDFSEPMQTEARRYLAAYAGRLQQAGGDLERPGVIARIGMGFDIIVTSHTLHHVSTLRLETLYEEIYEALHPGGVFINLDRSRRRSVAILQAIERGRLGRFLASRLRRWLRAGNDTGTHGNTRRGHLRLLRKAGFRARSQRVGRLLLTVGAKPHADGSPIR